MPGCRASGLPFTPDSSGSSPGTPTKQESKPASNQPGTRQHPAGSTSRWEAEGGLCPPVPFLKTRHLLVRRVGRKTRSDPFHTSDPNLHGEAGSAWNHIFPLQIPLLALDAAGLAKEEPAGIRKTPGKLPARRPTPHRSGRCSLPVPTGQNHHARQVRWESCSFGGLQGRRTGVALPPRSRAADGPV